MGKAHRRVSIMGKARRCKGAQSAHFSRLNKTLKEPIYSKRWIHEYHEIEASLLENDIMLHIDFAENYKNDQRDAIQNAYFRNQSFTISTAYCYAKYPNNNDVCNDNVNIVTERSDHDRVAHMYSV